MRKYITMIRPKKHKGVDTFLKIAVRLPDKEFLVVGDTDRMRQIKRIKNITHIPWTDKMSYAYSITKILLVPAKWHEPFGRVIVEAMANGIPVIASNRGGIPEVVGDAGILIDDPEDIDAWIDAIERLV